MSLKSQLIKSIIREEVAKQLGNRRIEQKTSKLRNLVKSMIKEQLLKETLDLQMTDFDSSFQNQLKYMFGGENVKLQDFEVAYRPSTDTGGKPHLYITFKIGQTANSNKGIMLSAGVWNKEGKGVVEYQNYSEDKNATKSEFEDQLIPAFKKAAVRLLGSLIKNPTKMNQATVGSGYKYEEADAESLEQYVRDLPNWPIKQS